MTKAGGLGQNFYVHGVDLSGDTSRVDNASSPRETQDATGINSNAAERILNRGSGRLAWTSFFNPAASQAHPTLSALPTTDIHVMWTLGTTRGDEVACLVAKQVNYDPSRAADASLLIAVEALGQGERLEWCDLLVAKKTHASATDETGIDFGSQTTAGGVGYLQHFSAASGTVEYDIEDSSNSTNGVDGAWANLLGFTDVATPWAATAQRVEVTGTVERWVRASTNGVFTTAVLAVAFRRGTADDDESLA